MTITSRGAVAPTSDQPGPGASADDPFDATALDVLVDHISAHATSWAETDAAARADLLQQVIADTMAAEEDWLAAACAAKGLAPGSTEAGEELFAGVGTFVRMARLRRDKKKWRRHQALTSGHNIKAVPRLRDAQPAA